jgi:hypothetical protein
MKKQGTKQHRRKKGPRIRLRCLGFVELASSRRSMTPFCAYYGPNGETCSQTRRLATVWTLPSIPPYTYLACPLHYEAVQQQVQRLRTSLEKLSRHIE